MRTMIGWIHARRGRASAVQLSLAAALLFLTAALVIRHVPGPTYVESDLWRYHFPVRAFYADCLKSGDSFDWMPSLFCGFYLTGEGQCGTYHPWHWLLYRILPLWAAFYLELLLHYPLMCAGMYLFLLRRIGQASAALLGAVVFTFSGFNLLHFDHPNAVAIIAHIPWLLLAMDVVCRAPQSGRARAAEIAIPLLTASQLLLGYPQYVWFSLILEGCYAVFLCIEPSSPRGSHGGQSAGELPVRSLLRIGALKALGAALGAVQLLPTVDALEQSTRRAADSGFLAYGSLDPMNVLQLVQPYLLRSRTIGGHPHETSLYFGAVPLLLVIWLLGKRKALEDQQRRTIAALVVFGCAALVLASGRFNGLYWLHQKLPLVGNFRMPSRYLLLCYFAAAVLAAIAFRTLGTQPRPADGVVAGIGRMWFVPLVSLVATLFVWAKAGEAALSPWPLVALGPLLLVTGVAALSLAERGSQTGLIILVLITALDLGSYGLFLNYASFAEPVPASVALSHVAAPPGEPDVRIVADALLPGPAASAMAGNVLAWRGWPQADGYAGLQPTTHLLGNDVSLNGLRVSAVRWVRRAGGHDQIAGLVPRTDEWLEVPEPLPRARLVTQVQLSRNPAQDISMVNPATTALVTQAVELSSGRAGEAEIVRDRPGAIQILTTAPSHQLLVVSESYHAGWQATVDGQRQTVLRINGDHFGCLVPPGTSEVWFRFAPRSLWLGRTITIAALLLWIAYAALRTAGRLLSGKRHL